MREGRTQRRLRKELGLIDVFAIATGTTLSAGFFLLPGIAAAQAGPAMVLSYLIAAVPLIPAMFCVVELSTAMPRAGGAYYFLDRTLGPVTGMIGGLGTWISMVLKVAFALVGMGAYLSLFFPQLSITMVGVLVAAAIALLNMVGTGKSGRIQVLLVFLLLAILVFFIGDAWPHIEPVRFSGFFDAGSTAILSTAGLVYISYAGVTKVTSLSEEVRDPERNLPLGVFLALGTALIIYALGTAVMVGVVPMEELAGDLTPVATTAERILGRPGVILVSLAAMAAFISVSNAGLLSASRYPLAMARDHLLPRLFCRLGRKGTPVVSILATLAVTILVILLLDPAGIAKLASSFQLLMFALLSLAVIVMRESHLEAYDPGYRVPWYPWTPLVGLLSPLVLIVTMGWLSILFTVGLLAVGAGWYAFYARGRIARTGAIYHVFERLGRMRYKGLDQELRGILKEKGLREKDPFDEIVARAMVIDFREPVEFDEVVERVSGWLAQIVPHTQKEIARQFLEGTRIGATPVTHGVALPHLRVAGLQNVEMILVRARQGIHISFNNPLSGHDEEEHVPAVFFLVSPEHDPGQHLRILAQIAGRVDDESFVTAWDAARNDQELKEALLHDERSVALHVRTNDPTSIMIGRSLREIGLPAGCLVTWLRRGEEVIVPHGSTVVEEDDRLTVIGDPGSIKQVRALFLPARGRRRGRRPPSGASLLAIPLLAVALALGACNDDGASAPPPDPLAQARSQWEAMGFDSYEITQRRNCFCVLGGQDVRLLVLRDSLVRGVNLADSSALAPEQLQWYYTIDGLFDFIAGFDPVAAAHYEIRFDSTFAYPAHFWIDPSEQIADEEIGYDCFDLHPLR
ncbi:MAG: amino acid permease [Bacteroidetes bacterium]|nr:amino acid permease [Bacteroidota bacterium]